MSKRGRLFHSLITNKAESGQGIVEYLIILALVAIILVAVVNTMRPAIADVFSRFVERAAVAPPALMEYTPPAPPAPPEPPEPVCYSLNRTEIGQGTIYVTDPPNPNCDDENEPDKYNTGTIITLEAVAQPGFLFGGWSQALTGTINPAQLLMDGNKDVTATFLDETDCSTVTYSVTPEGAGSVQPDQPFNCGENQFTNGLGVHFTAVPESGYIFEQWTGDFSGSNNPHAKIIDGDLNFTAVFVEHCYQVSLNVVGDGSINESYNPNDPCHGGGYPAGTIATFTAVPGDESYVFGGWSGSATGNDETIEIVLNQNVDLTATFNQCHTLTRTAIGNGNITPATDYNCSGERFQTGTPVQLAATSAPGHGFVSWGGAASGNDPITTIIINQDETVTANFTQCFALTTNVSPANMGEVNRLTGYSTNCNGDYYLPGTEVGLRADPDPNNGYQFGSWSGDISGTQNPTTFVINDNSSVTANFICELYAPWQNSSIGSGAGGQACESLGTYVVTGSGGDIWGSADRFHYAYQQRTGDFTIVARVNSQTNTAAWAKAGVMIRENLSAGSRYAFAAVTPGNGTRFQYRATANNNSNSSGVGGTAPRFLKLERLGNTFTAYYSSNGVTWTQYESQEVDMGSTVYYGLAVSSHNNNASTAVFTNVSIEATPACHAVTTAVTPAGSGSINMTPPFNCDGGYTSGTSVTLTALPNAGYQFDGWGGDLSGTNNPRNLTVDNPLNITAAFSPCSPSNIILNPGFESGLTHWNTQGNVNTTTDARSGNLAAQLSGTNADHTISQVHAAIPGYTYTASVWAKRRQAGWAGIGLTFFDSNWNELAVSSSNLIVDQNNYRFNSHTATAPANTAHVVLWIGANNFQNNNSFVRLDDVQMMAPVCN